MTFTGLEDKMIIWLYSCSCQQKLDCPDYVFHLKWMKAFRSSVFPSVVSPAKMGCFLLAHSFLAVARTSETQSSVSGEKSSSNYVSALQSCTWLPLMYTWRKSNDNSIRFRSQTLLRHAGHAEACAASTTRWQQQHKVTTTFSLP